MALELKSDRNERLIRAYISLEGLSIGDSFGQGYFIDPDVLESIIRARALPKEPWYFTDDTMMALSIVSNLRQYDRIDQDSLARSFANRYEPTRGYGPAMHRLLYDYRLGQRWQLGAPALFGGQGSFGNGASMRVAPLGAYFADDLDAAIENAALSAEVTHSHSEAIAGAIAVAVATAWACKLRETRPLPTRDEFLDMILPSVPRSEVSGKIRKARDMAPNASLRFAVAVLGNGVEISAQDTVPFTLWCAGKFLHDFAEALWFTVSGEGDRDTTCAMVGGIVVGQTGQKAIPPDWLKYRESLPAWPFEEG